MTVQRFESVFIETAQDGMTPLPDEFQAALAEVERNQDTAECWRCGDLVGWVLGDGPVAERLAWVPLGLVREIPDDAPPNCSILVRPMCESCTPYLDPVSYREMVRAARMAREGAERDA